MASKTTNYRVDIFKMNLVYEEGQYRFLWRVSDALTGEREFEDWAVSERAAKEQATRYVRGSIPRKTLVTTFYVSEEN